MAARGGAKKELDPEELMKRKFRAKCLFRALGRLVMANAYWLIEAVDHYEGLDDVKRRVQQAVRGKAKKKQLLTINDKALLNKPAEERTDQEKKYIFRIIGGLKCFKRYPNHVKKKLAAVTYFKYYSPGRTIVRQHHEAHALYFIITGDITVSQMIYDELLQQYVSVDVGIMHPGDMFGEVSLLHNIPRTATVTTTGHCELLALMKEDFKNVLQASVQKQWDEVRRAMSAFTYFDALDEVARREGCIVAKMKSYETNETLLGDGVGVANFVYFILSGKCQMIESLQVIVTSHLGKNYYSLYDPYVPKEESEQDFDTKYFGAYKNLNVGSKEEDSESKVEQAPSATIRESLKSAGSTAKLQSAIRQPRKSSASKRSIAYMAPEEDTNKRKSHDSSSSKQSAKELLRPSFVKDKKDSFRLSVISELDYKPPPQNLRTYFMQVWCSLWIGNFLFCGIEWRNELMSDVMLGIPHHTYSRTKRWSEVCRFNPGSSFGFGENMRDRRIVALTPVNCMLLPMIWLLQRNTANIWTRIQYYLEKKIPTKKKLFEEFVSSRRWQEFREQLVTDITSRSNTVNSTSVHDVPYSIRMEEMLDI